MKIIKDRMSNKLTGEDLSDRLLLSVEHNLMWQLNYADIISKYADTNELRHILYP